jgi:hypothetical protein
MGWPSLRRTIADACPRLRDLIRTRRQYRQHFGQTPSLLFPKTFNEKIQWRKVFDRNPLLPLLADKVLVKDFVTARLGSDWVTATLWRGPKLPPRAERNWPLPYVLKANHGSGMNYFVRSQEEIDWPRMEQLSEKWLGEVYGTWGCEWAYYSIKPQLLVEPFFGKDGVLPEDYKFWTFNGRVEFIQVDTDRESAHKRTMFDRSWKRLPFTIQYEMDQREIPRPTSLSQMISAADSLSVGLSFVRVDLYEIDSKPRFGEMTFYPGSGEESFVPPEYDRKIGDLWR